MEPVERASIRVAVVVLAAGKSSRMERSGHKLLARLRGVSLVRIAVLAAIGCGSSSVVVVTGFRSRDIEAEIAGLEISVARNVRYADGMASSIVLGVQRAVDLNPDGIMIMLADMPMLDAADLDALISAFQKSNGKSIVRAACKGVPGNPVIFPRSAFTALQCLQGDNGARAVITQSTFDVIDVEIGESAKIDIDTAEQLLAFGGQLEAG